jgi:O-antigen ligase
LTLTALAVGLAVSISLAEVALALLALALLAGAIAGRRAPTASLVRALPLVGPIAGFAAWTLIAALLSDRPLESIVAAKSVVWLATVWVVFHALGDRQSLRAFAGVFLVAIGIVAVVGIAQVAACPVASAGGVLEYVFRKCARARGFYSIYMTLGGVLMLVMVATLPWLVLRVRRVTALGAMWIVSAAALALTQVRGAWVGFALGAMVVAVATRRRAVVLALAVLAFVAVLALPAVRARFVYDQAADDRFAMLAGGFAIAREHPVAGIGPGQVKHVYPVYAPPSAHRRSTSHLHDTPMQILVERGVVGLVLWAAIFLAFFHRVWTVYRALPPTAVDDRALVLGAGAAIAAFLAAGMFEYNFGDTEVLLVACALMALPFVVERMQAPVATAGGTT